MQDSEWGMHQRVCVQSYQKSPRAIARLGKFTKVDYFPVMTLSLPFVESSIFHLNDAIGNV